MPRRLSLFIPLSATLLAAALPAAKMDLELVASVPTERMVFATHADDGSGRLYMVLQQGQIHVAEEDGNLLDDLFIDIADRIKVSFDQGLLGMAFHPDYAENGRFFLSYTRAGDGASIISEYRCSDANPLVANPNSERIVLGPVFRENSMHNGGMIEFGPLDGLLYFTLGDGQEWDNGQDLSTILGGMGRIDVDNVASGERYAIPPDNPWVGAGGASEELFAIGLRNPWRWSADPLTGRIIVGDVGNLLMEEVSIITRGANLGWNIMEADLCFDPDNQFTPLPDCDMEGLALPIYSYLREDTRRSVTGGYTYRGEALPDLEGVHIFTDFYSGDIDTLTELPSGEWEHRVIMTVPWATDFSWMTSLGVDENGEVLIIDARDIGHGGGNLYRLIYAEDAIVVDPISDAIAEVGSDYIGPLPALFQEGTPAPGSGEIEWSLVDALEDMTIDSETGQVSWTIAGSIGDFARVTVAVTGATSSDEETWFIEVATPLMGILDHLLTDDDYQSHLDLNGDLRVDVADLVRGLN